jgi:Zn-dependent protease with chaperone function
MNFFVAQDEARRRSRKLVWLFIAAVVCTGLSIHLGFAAVVHWNDFRTGFDPRFFEAGMLPFTFGGALLVIVIGAFHKRSSLSGGGPAVAEALGGTRVDPASTDPAERRLLNVVEEMAIASGTPVPAVFVLNDEEAINAFAAGLESSDAVVAVSRGCMRRLTRDELQGVVAHEFSHILNGDMRLNFRMVSWIAGILCLTLLGRALLEVGLRAATRSSGSRSDKKEKNGIALLLALAGLVLVVVGAVGTFFGRWIQSAVSRQREFLADASAVQFTRLSSGISGALKKIGGYDAGSVLHAPRAAEASHMMFGESLQGFFSRLFFATHPPLEDRIRALEPGWTGQMLPAPELDSFESEPSAENREEAMGFAAASSKGMSIASELGQMPHDAESGYAHELVHSLPRASLARARDVNQAPGLVLELVRAAGVEEHPAEAMGNAEADWAACSGEQRMALLHLAMPALRMLQSDQISELIRACEAEVANDGQIFLMELAVIHLVRRHLSIASGLVKPPRERFRSIRDVADSARTILSAVAAVGSSEDAACEAAFSEGWSALELEPVSREPLSELSVGRLDAALGNCEAASLSVRKMLLEACMRTSAHDGIWMPNERLLVRAVADAIGASLPPIVA